MRSSTTVMRGGVSGPLQGRKTEPQSCQGEEGQADASAFLWLGEAWGVRGGSTVEAGGEGDHMAPARLLPASGPRWQPSASQPGRASSCPDPHLSLLWMPGGWPGAGGLRGGTGTRMEQEPPSHPQEGAGEASPGGAGEGREHVSTPAPLRGAGPLATTPPSQPHGLCACDSLCPPPAYPLRARDPRAVIAERAPESAQPRVQNG